MCEGIKSLCKTWSTLVSRWKHSSGAGVASCVFTQYRILGTMPSYTVPSPKPCVREIKKRYGTQQIQWKIPWRITFIHEWDYFPDTHCPSQTEQTFFLWSHRLVTGIIHLNEFLRSLVTHFRLTLPIEYGAQWNMPLCKVLGWSQKSSRKTRLKVEGRAKIANKGSMCIHQDYSFRVTSINVAVFVSYWMITYSCASLYLALRLWECFVLYSPSDFLTLCCQ